MTRDSRAARPRRAVENSSRAGRSTYALGADTPAAGNDELSPCGGHSPGRNADRTLCPIRVALLRVDSGNLACRTYWPGGGGRIGGSWLGSLAEGPAGSLLPPP